MSGAIAALILSAGFSSRMGDFKPLLPLAGVTALERVVQLFKSAGISDVRVVTGFRGEELEPSLKRLEARGIVNDRYRDGMFSSVTAGVKTVGAEVDAFFLLPVDIPLVRPTTVRLLLEEYRRTPCDLLYPRCLGKRGHPPLIAASLAPEIASWPGDEGLRGALARWERSARDLDVADEHIHHDMDTPEAYDRLARDAQRLEIPTEAEAMALLRRHVSEDSSIIRHGNAVANLAAELGRRLNRQGYRFDLELLRSAGLLHDIARQEADHAKTGARLLRQAGFGAAADPVECHMDLTVNGDGEEALETRHLLYLADKLTEGDRHVDLAQRFSTALERHGNAPETYQSITARLQTARILQTRLETLLGYSLAEVIRTL